VTEEAERLYEQALALPAASRVAFVRDACADRPALGDELVSLLAHAGVAERFFDRLGGVVRSAMPAVEPARSDDPMFGRIVGRFRITALLGRGGMGAVYRARDERLDRDVALKFLPPQEALDPGAVERFLVEARAAGTLSHPNVCTIHEIGETADGRPYIAMALYEGETLRQRIARGPLTARDAAVIARDIARALGAAHARGIVHRDVKPGNVMLGRDGVTRLLDFGLARFSDASITGTGSAPGTIAYMSPEQVDGVALDHRSDLWSLGVVMHEMLAGRRPFEAGGERAIVLAIVRDAAPSLAELQPPVPPALQRIVERLMRKVPAERYRDAAELESDLDAFITGNPTATSSPSSGASRHNLRRVPRRALIVATVAGVIALATAFPLVSRWRGAVQASPMARSLAVLPFVDLSGDTANRYFSDGLSEEIITRLGRIAGLRVAARSSAFALRDRSLDARQIGDTLGVNALLEGSVRRAGQRLRVSARLVDAKSGLQLWADEYDREMADVLTVQDEIARAIANALALRMPAAIEGAVARGPVDPEAYDLYLHALTLRSQLRPDAMRRAAELLDRAIERQPDFALAWAAKASVVAPLVFFGQIPAEEGLPVVRAAIDRAFALDPQSGEAYTARGMLQLFWEWDWAGAGRTLRQATVLNPSDPHAWHHLGNYLRAVNRLDEAVAARLRGLTLDPLDARLQNSLGEDYLAAGRLAEARAAFERGSQLDPLHPIQLGLGPGAPHGVWNVFLEEGREAEAVAELLRVAALRGATADEVQALRAAFATAGMHGFWRRWLVMDERQSNGRPDSMRVATLRALAGDSTGALDILERAFASQSPAIIFIRTEPAFAELRTHPRFVRVVEGMHFPPR
jgi:serine/threonine-protein kinase